MECCSCLACLRSCLFYGPYNLMVRTFVLMVLSGHNLTGPFSPSLANLTNLISE